MALYRRASQRSRISNSSLGRRRPWEVTDTSDVERLIAQTEEDGQSGNDNIRALREQVHVLEEKLQAISGADPTHGTTVNQSEAMVTSSSAPPTSVVRPSRCHCGEHMGEGLLAGTRGPILLILSFQLIIILLLLLMILRRV